MLAMLADTMIPEAFDEARNWAGLITVMGSWWLCFDKAGWLRRPRFQTNQNENALPLLATRACAYYVSVRFRLACCGILSRSIRAERPNSPFGVLVSPLFNGSSGWGFREKHRDPTAAGTEPNVLLIATSAF
jgi:hypothetical protein